MLQLFLCEMSHSQVDLLLLRIFNHVLKSSIVATSHEFSNNCPWYAMVSCNNHTKAFPMSHYDSRPRETRVELLGSILRCGSRPLSIRRPHVLIVEVFNQEYVISSHLSCSLHLQETHKPDRFLHTSYVLHNHQDFPRHNCNTSPVPAIKLLSHCNRQ